jgi:multifunctional beta-oxidation protein
LQYGFPNNKELTPEDVVSKWKEITTFDKRATHPSSTQEALQQIVQNFENTASGSSSSSSSSSASTDDSEDPQIVEDAKKRVAEKEHFPYTERDVILYNLGIGATEKDLQWVYENDEKFGVSSTSILSSIVRG